MPRKLFVLGASEAEADWIKLAHPEVTERDRAIRDELIERRKREKGEVDQAFDASPTDES